MKAKKIITIMMALTLALGVVGCGKDEEDTSTSTTQEESSDSEKDSKVLTQAEKDLFKLGARQTQAIKTIVENYGIKTSYMSDGLDGASIEFSKDENDCGEPDTRGYSIFT